MRIASQRDIEGLREAGRAVAVTLAEMGRAIEPGITTASLDALGATHLERFRARSAPQCVYDFPGVTCISVNEEAAHGIPGDRELVAGDIVNIDVSAELEGYFADTGATWIVAPAKHEQQRLLAAAQAALDGAMAVARAGRLMNIIGRTIERIADREGFTTLRDLGSHGVGRGLHEEPRFIQNFHDPKDLRRLQDGLVITIEPFLSTGATACTTARDGWTLLSGKGNRSAQFEHTMIIGEDAPTIMTLP